jgi:hypothetical protein
MATKVASLANEIAVLEEDEQQALWEQVAALNYRRGLRALSDWHRQRLQEQGELDRSAQEILAELRQIREETVAYATYSQVQELVAQLPAEKLPILYNFLVDLGMSPTGPLSFQEEFMLLPLAERRRLMAEQAKQMVLHYEEEPSERQGWQAGDFVDY